MGRPARVDHRGPPDGGRAGPRGPRHPRHVRAHDLAVPRQAVDEGGAAPGGRPDRRVGRRRTPPTRPSTFADAVGFPLILKPRAGAGAPGHRPGRLDDRARARRSPRSATPTRSRSRSSSRATRASTTRSPSTATSRTTGSRTTTPTCSRRCGTAGSRRSSSPPTASTTRRFYAEVREMGARVIEALGIGTSATHMEWFYGPKGLRFSEIGCRPPGVGAWDLYSAANDVDVYREWAHAIVHGGAGAAAVAALRRRHRRAAPRPGRPDPRLLRARRDPAARTASGSSTPTCPTRAPAPSRSRPATWPTPGSGCGTPTTTRCAACSTTSDAPSTSTPDDREAADDDRPSCSGPSASGPRPGPRCARSRSTARSRPSPPAGRSARATTPSSTRCWMAAAATSASTAA